MFLRTLTGHTSRLYSVAFSPDGETLASGSSDNTIKLWDVSSGMLVRTLSGHTSYVYSVAFSPDGETTLASGSVDHTIKLWDVASGILLRTLTGHTSNVHSVAFSSYGETLASGSNDGTVLLWDVASILDPNEAPTASFTWQALSSSGTRLVVEPRTGDRIEFDASASSDPDGNIVEYAWDWNSDGSYNEKTTGSVIDHTFTDSGSHRVTLRVTDNDGASLTSVTLTVNSESATSSESTVALTRTW
jgi:WD40 repeat protein